MDEKIIDIIVDILGIDKNNLKDNLTSKDIWDSLRRIEIIFAVEDELDIKFEEDELAHIATPQMLIDIANQKG